LWIGYDYDVAATTTVAAIWTAEGNEFFAPKAHGAAATIPRPNGDMYFVDESN
jgi:hypothetical protein